MAGLTKWKRKSVYPAPLISDLWMFVALAEEGNFAKAGKRCNVTPWSVNMAVERLEHHYNVVLVARKSGRNGYSKCTEAGQELYRIAKKIVNRERYIKHRLAAYRQTVHPHFRGCPIVGQDWILEYAKKIDPSAFMGEPELRFTEDDAATLLELNGGPTQLGYGLEKPKIGRVICSLVGTVPCAVYGDEGSLQAILGHKGPYNQYQLEAEHQLYKPLGISQVPGFFVNSLIEAAEAVKNLGKTAVLPVHVAELYEIPGPPIGGLLANIPVYRYAASPIERVFCEREKT